MQSLTLTTTTPSMAMYLNERKVSQRIKNLHVCRRRSKATKKRKGTTCDAIEDLFSVLLHFSK